MIGLTPSLNVDSLYLRQKSHVCQDSSSGQMCFVLDIWVFVPKRKTKTVTSYSNSDPVVWCSMPSCHDRAYPGTVRFLLECEL